jgi:hypothetical protein
MLQTLEAIIDERGYIQFLEQVTFTHRSQRALVTLLTDENEPASIGRENTLLSEVALAADWNHPDEDQAWAHLQ